MSRIEKILVPVDFSASSAYALEYAIDLAKGMGARIHLLHAYSLPTQIVGPYEVAPIPNDFFEQVRQSASKHLAQSREKVRAAGIECEASLTDGAPADAIAETAQEVGADLIVMGTRGHTGLKHVLLGSVAERTVRIAPCPVLTTRKKGD
ncbi:MAG: universal stress protein [Deltaproteobacteria bacterium]|nr:MAG: universal stress protein [Deltaproteobacteria bacterium]